MTPASVAGAGPSERALIAARAAYGAGLLLLPADALATLARARLDRASVRVARVLGARQLLQSVIVAARPGWGRPGAGVDALHAASMVAFARASSRPLHRMLAARDARSAALFAVLGMFAR